MSDNPQDTDPSGELVRNFTRVAEAMFSAGGVDPTLQTVVDLAVDTIEGCDYASIFVSRAGMVTSPALSDPMAAELDALQLRGNEGPCIDAIAGSSPCYADDLARDPRWPSFGPAAAAAGVRSLLSLRLSADGTLGALNLYARYPSAFGAVDRARGLVVAGLAGIALSLARANEEHARLAENLRQALMSREVVGQAQGILMERERITAEQAFDILRRASQHLNVKLRQVAQDLVDTGERPETGVGPQSGAAHETAEAVANPGRAAAGAE